MRLALRTAPSPYRASIAAFVLAFASLATVTDTHAQQQQQQSREREALRRAQPVSLLVRFAPRQRQKPLVELLAPSSAPPQLDPLGSLVDADMGAYYNWINQQRLPGAEKSMFLVWFENHREALVVSPALPRATVSAAATTIPQLLSWLS